MVHKSCNTMTSCYTDVVPLKFNVDLHALMEDCESLKNCQFKDVHGTHFICKYRGMNVHEQMTTTSL